MSFAVDADILVHASDTGSPFHRRAAGFLRECTRGPEVLCLPWTILFGYLRASTHPGIFSRPLPPFAARANVASLLAQPNVRAVAEGDRFWECYAEVAGSVLVYGELTPHAHVAAILVEHDVSLLYTHDDTFKAFHLLCVRDPLAP